MQKQDTHSFCTTLTKIEENTLAPPSSPPSEEVTQIQLLEVPRRAPTDIGPSEDEEKSRSGCEVRGSKKCYNQRCKSLSIHKKVKSRVQKNRYRFFCQECYQCYQNLQFCEFCEQIYGNDIDQDDEINYWVGCDTCQRWNHITCEIAGRGLDFKTLQNENSRYHCLKCANDETSKKLRNGQRPRSESHQKEYQRIENPKIPQPSQERVEIEWKKEGFGQLDIFLNNLSQKQYIASIFDFKLSLSGDLVKYDINRLRHSGVGPTVFGNRI